MVAVGSRSLRFADTARLLTDTLRQGGLVAPTFRSPPRVLGRDRTLRRRGDGTVTIAVRLGGRPFVAVVADMIDGVIRTNELDGPTADEWRRALWSAVETAAVSPVREAA